MAIKKLDYINGIESSVPPTGSPCETFNAVLPAVTANTAISDTDPYGFVTVDATAADVKITLPDATTTPGRKLAVKKIDSTQNAVCVDTVGGQTIDGETDHLICEQFGDSCYVSDGTNWCNFNGSQVRYQKKNLNSFINITPAGFVNLDSTTGNSNFKFDNLTVGKVYTLRWQLQPQFLVSQNAVVRITNSVTDGANILTALSVGGNVGINEIDGSITFEAVDTAIRIWIVSGNVLIDNSNAGQLAFLQLEQHVNYELTTQWT